MGGGGSERFWEVGWFLWLELWVMSWLQMQIVARKPRACLDAKNFDKIDTVAFSLLFGN
jgi:hypothetical protein